MAPRPLSPLVLALGGAAALLGSVLFILWKTYSGRGRERRWDRGEGWWGAEPARLPEWDEWDVSAGPAPPRERRERLGPGRGAAARRLRAGSRAVGTSGAEAWVGPGLWGGGLPAGGVGAAPRAARAGPAPAQCARPGGCREALRRLGSRWRRCAVPDSWSLRPGTGA